MKNYDEFLVVNIFTHSCGTILPVPDEEVTAIRQQEDRVIHQRYGIQFYDCQLPDTSLRGVGWDDITVPVDNTLLRDVQQQVEGQLSRIGEFTALYIPGAYGLHPDHYLALIAFASGQLREMLGRIEWYVYCDQQYYSEGKAFHPGHVYLKEHGHLMNHGFDPKEKRDMEAVYASQLSDSRLDLLTNDIREEYYWRVDEGFLDATLKRFQKKN